MVSNNFVTTDARVAEKRLKKISHPDEIEKKKHFIGVANKKITGNRLKGLKL